MLGDHPTNYLVVSLVANKKAWKIQAFLTILGNKA